MGTANGKFVEKSDIEKELSKAETLKMVNQEIPGFKFVNVPTSEKVVNGV